MAVASPNGNCRDRTHGHVSASRQLHPPRLKTFQTALLEITANSAHGEEISQTKRRRHDFVLSLVRGTSHASLCFPYGNIEINCCCCYNIIRKTGGELLSICYNLTIPGFYPRSGRTALSSEPSTGSSILTSKRPYSQMT